LEKEYRAFKERQTQRRKIFGYSVSLLSIYILLGAYIYFNESWLFILWAFAGVFGFFFGFLYVMSQSWAQEMYETDIFVDMYEASNLLELCRKKDEDSMFYSRKVSNKVSSAIRSLGNLCTNLDKIFSRLIKREFAKPLNQLKENLETRILPRIAQNRDTETMIHVLRGLAQLFGEVAKPTTLQDIILKNKDLERFEPIELEKAPSRLRILLSMNPIRLLCSFLLSFSIITIPLFIRSMFVPTDLMDLLGLPTFIEILGIGFAIALGIYAIWKRRT